MKYKLNFELVPDGCWGSNLRNILSKKQWDFIRQIAKDNSENKCAICGKNAKRLECHEVWDYDEINHIQKLKDVIAVCHDCHSVIHIGRTAMFGQDERAEKHYMKVNKCSYAEFRKKLGEANEIHKRRNEISDWALDVSFLKEFIGLD